MPLHVFKIFDLSTLILEKSTLNSEKSTLNLEKSTLISVKCVREKFSSREKITFRTIQTNSYCYSGKIHEDDKNMNNYYPPRTQKKYSQLNISTYQIRDDTRTISDLHHNKYILTLNIVIRIIVIEYIY